MTAMEMFTGYSVGTAVKVAVLLAVVLALRLVIVPFALIAVLLDPPRVRCPASWPPCQSSRFPQPARLREVSTREHDRVP